MLSSPQILERAGALLRRYEVVFCDVWGVVHDGTKAFPEANDALTRFRAAGGTVILVSNAPLPADAVARVLAEKAVPSEAWDAIVASGDIAIAHCRARGFERLYHLGPRRDRPLFAALPGRAVPIEEAEAIVASGLLDDRRETAEDYRGLLLEALARRIPLICANPDLVVDVGTRRLPCAGLLGELYARLGGDVVWAGKPYPAAYATALAKASALRGAPLGPSRVLAIGDGIRTDLMAASGAGIDALFIAAGIHADEAMEEGLVSEEKLARLFGPGSPSAVAAIDRLRW
jgi:HAD superfamily hydrolase (TIGR01459 family)